MVSISSMMMMCLTLMICFGVPLGLFWFVRRRYQASIKSFFVGLIVFIVTTQILEAVVHVYLLKVNQTTSIWLMQPLIYSLYGGLMAGVFEETGRYFSFKWFLKKENRIQDGVSYGIGHGGIEAMLIVGTTYLNNLIFSVLINQGWIEKLGLSAELEETVVTQLTQISPIIFGLAGYERLMTIMIQIGLSLLVFKGVREQKICYYVLAVFIHAILDVPAALVQVGMFNIYVVEGFITLIAIGFIIFMVKQFKNYHEDLTKVEDIELEKYKQAGY